MTPLKPKAECMAALDPRNTVGHNKAVGNGDIKISGTETLISNTKRVCVKRKYGKKGSAGIGDSKRFWPILAGETVGYARVVQPIKTDIEMIEQGRTDGFVPAKSKIVRESRLEKIRVEGRREGLRPVKLFLVATAVGKEEFVRRPPVLINPETHR